MTSDTAEWVEERLFDIEPDEPEIPDLHPDELVHKPTIAELRSETCVSMCGNCGCLIATRTKVKLGMCPTCAKQQWIKQPTECGPFRRHKEPTREQ
jgi:hypothetical protein